MISEWFSREARWSGNASGPQWEEGGLRGRHAGYAHAQ